MKKLQLMARACAAAATLMLFGLFTMSFSTVTTIPAPVVIQSADSCPTAGFSFSGTVNGLPTSFTNLSTQYSTCSWDFGDGSTSTATNPQHTYASPGVYQVRLTVFGSDCSTSFIGTVDVIAG